MPKYSVAIPAYKSKYIRAAIESVLCQTTDDYEIIILNDCSPEPIAEIVKSYKDSRIKYYENEHNIGIINVVDNWNKCLELANGDYLICMGDDDELAPDCFSIYNEIIDKYPNLDIYHGQAIVIGEEGEPLFAPLSRPEWESALELIYYRMFERKQYVGDFLYRISVLRSNGGFYKLPAAWGSDDISAIIAARQAGIANTHNIVFKYRANPYSISSSGSIDIKMSALTDEEKWYRIFLNEYECKDNNDLLFKNFIFKEIKKHYSKKRLRMIADDLMNEPLHIFRWLKISERIGLTKSMVLYALIMSVRDKKSISYQNQNK